MTRHHIKDPKHTADWLRNAANKALYERAEELGNRLRAAEYIAHEHLGKTVVQLSELCHIAEMLEDVPFPWGADDAPTEAAPTPLESDGLHLVSDHFTVGPLRQAYELDTTRRTDDVAIYMPLCDDPAHEHTLQDSEHLRNLLETLLDVQALFLPAEEVELARARLQQPSTLLIPRPYGVILRVAGGNNSDPNLN